MDLLAECSLWTAPWTGFPRNQDSGYTEELASSAALWSDVPFYHDADGAQPLPSSTGTRPQPQ